MRKIKQFIFELFIISIGISIFMVILIPALIFNWKEISGYYDIEPKDEPIEIPVKNRKKFRI